MFFVVAAMELCISFQNFPSKKKKGRTPMFLLRNGKIEGKPVTLKGEKEDPVGGHAVVPVLRVDGAGEDCGL